MGKKGKRKLHEDQLDEMTPSKLIENAVLFSERCRKKRRREVDQKVEPLFRSFDNVFIPTVGMEGLQKVAAQLFLEKSFWKPRNAEPKNFFERLADEIFDCHTEGKSFSSGGIEWWVQIRGKNTKYGNSLGFHWDEDYQDYDENSASSVKKPKRTPHIATVTYLSDWGAPTVVLNRGPLTPAEIEEDDCLDIDEGFVSFPQFGKHVAFRGDLLHGVPAEFKRKLNKKIPRTRRVTFLANIWLDSEAPSNVHEFKETDVPTQSAFRKALEDLNAPEGSLLQFHHYTNQKEYHTTSVEAMTGFSFGKDGEAFELFMPLPPFPGPHHSFHLKFRGGEDAPCYIQQADS